MEPEVIEVDQQILLTYEQNKLGQAAEKNRAWVGYGDRYYAVGYLAQWRFAGTPGLTQLKYERAIPKTLAAVWVASRQFQMGNKFSIAIAIVLPPGEYADATNFEKLITEALADYQTPTGRLQVKLKLFNCKPEGGGIYMMFAKNQGKQLLGKVCAVIMLGYRNASILVSNRGEVGKFRSSDLGFIQLLNGVLQKTSGQTPERLTPAIFEAGEEIAMRSILPLTRSSDEQRRSEEVEILREAIRTARREYTLQLISWMKEILPRDLNEVVICGGTADYLKPELKDYFCWTPIHWHGGIKIPDELDINNLGNRFTDVYCLFVYFRKIILKSEDYSPPLPTEQTTAATPT
ncbi:MAG TPA: hypothetical protein DD379_20815 [Cyanobacteria bacterium UBA11162]|nr:hypothetical protein [Cyanobacteria bacterium UBA11162]